MNDIFHIDTSPLTANEVKELAEFLQSDRVSEHRHIVRFSYDGPGELDCCGGIGCDPGDCVWSYAGTGYLVVDTLYVTRTHFGEAGAYIVIRDDDGALALLQPGEMTRRGQKSKSSPTIVWSRTDPAHAEND